MSALVQSFFSAQLSAAPALLLLAVALASGFTDLWRGKIFNGITYPAMAACVLLQVWQHGAAGLALALGGFAIGFFPPFMMFAMGKMSGGDVKLLGAIGIIAGPVVATETLFLAFLFGGLFALGKLAWHGELFDSLLRSLRLLAGYVVPGLGPAPPSTTQQRTVKFGVAICVAALATLWDLRTGALSGLSGLLG
jgi:Flp pilus assembly protein protease CpaA